MFSNPTTLVLLTGIAGGVWPVLMRYSALSPLAVATFVSVTSAIIVLTAGKHIIPGGNTTELTFQPVVIAIVSALLNTIAFLSYSKLISHSEWDISQYLPVALALMLIVPAFAGMCFLGEAFTFRKISGITIMIFGMYLLFFK